MCVELQDTELLATLYNRVRVCSSKEEDDENERLHGIAFDELVTFIAGHAW